MAANASETAARTPGEPRGEPHVQVGSLADWETWLEANHVKATGVWLKMAKQGAGTRTVTYEEAVEGALCYGWIDGQKAPLDDQFWLQRFTPRRPRSKWSRINRDKATALLRQGRLRPAGIAQVEAAQRDGRWDAAYESQSRANVPDDLQRALDACPAASAFFAELKSADRYAVLYRVQDAKRPETRARRIAQYVAMLADGKTLRS